LYWELFWLCLAALAAKWFITAAGPGLNKRTQESGCKINDHNDLISSQAARTGPLHETPCLAIPPGPSRVVSTLASLPEHVRLAILTMVQSAT
jgi:hypothetical protein